MIDVPLLTDLDAICSQKQQLIEANLIKENEKQIDYNYKSWRYSVDRAQRSNKDGAKKAPWTIYQITRIYVNGTIDIQLKAGVIQRYNIQKVVPYRHSEHSSTPLTNECHYTFEVKVH